MKMQRLLPKVVLYYGSVPSAELDEGARWGGVRWPGWDYAGRTKGLLELLLGSWKEDVLSGPLGSKSTANRTHERAIVRARAPSGVSSNAWCANTTQPPPINLVGKGTENSSSKRTGRTESYLSTVRDAALRRGASCRVSEMIAPSFWRLLSILRIVRITTRLKLQNPRTLKYEIALDSRVAFVLVCFEGREEPL